MWPVEETPAMAENIFYFIEHLPTGRQAKHNEGAFKKLVKILLRGVVKLANNYVFYFTVLVLLGKLTPVPKKHSFEIIFPPLNLKISVFRNNLSSVVQPLYVT